MLSRILSLSSWLPRAVRGVRHCAASPVGLVCLTFGLLTACGGGGDSTGPATPASMTLTGPSSNLASLGETATLQATVKDAKGRAVTGATLTWTSSDPSVASVSGGTVTAVRNGTAQITATTGSVSASTSVTVLQVAASIAVTSLSDSLFAIDDTVRVTAIARDARGGAMSGVAFAYTSLNPAVFTVTDGLVRSVSEGTTSVRVTSGALQADKALVVKQKAARIRFSAVPATARAGQGVSGFTVQVVDSRNAVVGTNAGTAVTLSATTSGGTVVSGGTGSTSNGAATFGALVLGGTAGRMAVRATATGVGTVDTAVTLLAGTPTTLTGTGTTANALANTEVTLQGVVRDAYGNATGPATVAWRVLTGTGTLSSAQSTVDSTGVAAVRFKLSATAGANVVRAEYAGTATVQVTYTLTGTPNGTIIGNVPGLASASLRSGLTARTMAMAGQASRRGATSASVATAASGPMLPPLPARLTEARSDMRAAMNANAGMSAGVSTSVSIGTVRRASSNAAAQATANRELLVTYKSAVDPVQLTPGGTAGMTAAAWRQSGVAMAARARLQTAIAPFASAGRVKVLGISPVVATVRVQVPDGQSLEAVAAELRADPAVQAVETNGVVFLDRDEAAPERVVSAPVGASLAMLWGGTAPTTGLLTDDGRILYAGGGLFPTVSNYISQSWHYNLAGLPRAWQITQGNSDVLVAVIDNGVRPTHPAMAGLLTADGYDFVSRSSFPLCAGGTIDAAGDGDGYDPDPTIPADYGTGNNGTCATTLSTDGNHGLHVGGTIVAAANNTMGITGVNQRVRLRMVRALGVYGSGSFYDISQAILYAAGLPADNGANGVVQASVGARLINMSLGGSQQNLTQQSAVQQATAAGSLIIASAGNNGNSVLNYPASFPEVISVSAVGPSGTKAGYSSFGSTVDITAPGGSFAESATGGVYSSTWNFVAQQPSFAGFQGTSMAAPHVTGIAALLLSREPTLTAAQVRDRLERWVIDIGQVGTDPLYGKGMINARNVLTQSFAPAGTARAFLVDSKTGAMVSSAVISATGDFRFTEVADGTYWVFAGMDENDNDYGAPGRLWTAYGSAGAPTTVIVQASSTSTLPALDVAVGTEREPNGSVNTASELLVDRSIKGELTPNDIDVYRLRITTSGLYTVLAQGQVGACGYAGEADPIIGIYNPDGSLIDANGDINAATNNLCAQVTRVLAPGTYYIQVAGTLAGRYVLSARRTAP